MIATSVPRHNVWKQVSRKVSEVKLREPLHLNLIAHLFSNPHLGCCLSELLSGLFLAIFHVNWYRKRLKNEAMSRHLTESERHNCELFSLLKRPFTGL